MEEASKLEQQLIDNLNLIKTEFFKNKDELKVSIRKDVVAIELKTIIDKSNTFDELKNNINSYISTLYTPNE